MRRLLTGPAFVGLCLLATLWLFPLVGTVPAQAQSPPDAYSIMEKVLLRARDVKQKMFEQEIEVTRLDEPYLAPFLPPYRDPQGLIPRLPGKIVIRPLESFQISLQERQNLQWLTFTSKDGCDIEGTPFGSPSPSPSPSVEPSPSASPMAGETSSPSPDATASPEASPMPTVDTDRSLYRYHPLTLLWPHEFKPNLAEAQYKYNEEEIVYGSTCWEIEQKNRDITLTLWVDQSTYGIRQIEYDDPMDGQRVRATYTEMYQVSDLSVYKKVELAKGGRPLLSVLVPNLPVLVQRPRVETGAPSPSWTPPPRTVISNPEVWTRGLLFIVIVLLIGLSWFGGRYLKFLLTRSRFSEELLLVEAEGGPVFEVLTEMGYTVIPATMELLTEERKFLGKKPGADLPRAVVIAPGAFAQIKGYLFLLRAYVEEGGRVLVLTQTPSHIATMPFTPYFVPNLGEGKNVVLSRPNFWKRLRVEDVETRIGPLLPREFYVEINQKRPDLDLVQVYNQATGVRASAVCVVREGKGEYLLCQLLLVDELQKNKRPRSLARFLMADLIEYLQGRQGEKKPTAPPGPQQQPAAPTTPPPTAPSASSEVSART